jgi:hypothetical protein
VNRVNSRWAQIGDILSIQPGHGTTSSDLIRSAVAGVLTVDELRHSLCCPQPEQECDMAHCSVTNSSISADIHTVAASRFRAMSSSSNASRAFSLVVQPGVPLVLVSTDFMFQEQDTTSNRALYRGYTRACWRYRVSAIVGCCRWTRSSVRVAKQHGAVCRILIEPTQTADIILSLYKYLL